LLTPLGFASLRAAFAAYAALGRLRDRSPTRVVPSAPVTPTSQRFVIAVVSNKGGVGKTTVATNLAVTLRALHEDLPILLLTLDDQSIVERMFRLGPKPARGLKHAFAERSFDGLVELGQYGVHFVAAPSDVEALKLRALEPLALRKLLDTLRWEGVIILDTKSDLEALTRGALAAADLAILPVADQASFEEAAKAFALLDQPGSRRGRGRVLITLVDRRTKLDAAGRDLYERLVAAVDAAGWPRFTTYLSRSPRVEALNSGAERPRAILHEAKGTAVHRQMRELAEEITKLLGLGEPASAEETPSAAPLAHAGAARPAPRAERSFAADLRDAFFRGGRGR
jgi:cellulose biosynthesis protein BcsQ